jgi:predicted site-specific integrase-resolvase
MADKLLTKKELAERWQVEERTIDNWRKDGVVHAVKGIPVVRFTEQHILELEGVKLDRMSPLERRRLEQEIDSLKSQNEQLKGIISKVLAETSQVVGM